MRVEAKAAIASTIGTFALDHIGWALVQVGFSLAPEAARIIAICFFALGAVSALLWLHIAWDWARRNGWGTQMGIALIVVGLIGGASVVGWGVYTIYYPVKNVTAAQLRQKARVFVECAMNTSVLIPPNGILPVVQLSATGLGGVGNITGTPGERAFPLDPPVAAFVCNLTNYSDQPMFEVEMVFHGVFRETVRGAGTGRQSGRTVLDKDFSLKIPKVDPRPGIGASFVLLSLLDGFVTMDVVSSATARVGLDKTRVSLDVDASGSPTMEFFPFDKGVKIH